jgi:hypothetical protein
LVFFWITWFILGLIGLGGFFLTKSHQIIGESLPSYSTVSKDFYVWGNQWSWIYFRHYYNAEEGQQLLNTNCIVGDNSIGSSGNSSFMGVTMIVTINSQEDFPNCSYGRVKGDCINGKFFVYSEAGTALNLSIYHSIIHLTVNITTSSVDGYYYMIVQNSPWFDFWYLGIYIIAIGGSIISILIQNKLKKNTDVISDHKENQSQTP